MKRFLPAGRRSVAAFISLTLATTAPALAQDPALERGAAGPADRVWSNNPDDQQLWLRRAFALPDKVSTARLVFTCDNECRVLLNGVEVGTSKSWMDVTVVDLERLGRDNLIAVEANNTGGPGAFACWLLWTDANGDQHTMVSDASWKVTTAAGDAPAGWDQIGFDDSGWQAATPNFTAEFGRNLYNGEPTQVHFRNRHSQRAEAIADGLAQLRRAINREAARKALDAIERAVMEMRTQLWREEQTEKRPEQPRRDGR